MHNSQYIPRNISKPFSASHNHHHSHLQSSASLPVILIYFLFLLFPLANGYRTSGTTFSTLSSESLTLSPRTVTTKYGQIRGSLVKLSGVSTSTYDLLDVEAYLGVPYATPPIGGLRFMPPVTPNHWRGVRLANRLQPLCPQRISPEDKAALQNEADALKRITRARLEYLRKLIPRLANQSEDCLYLNIYSPVTDNGPRKGKFSATPLFLLLFHPFSRSYESENKYYFWKLFLHSLPLFNLPSFCVFVSQNFSVLSFVVSFTFSNNILLLFPIFFAFYFLFEERLWNHQKTVQSLVCEIALLSLSLSLSRPCWCKRTRQDLRERERRKKNIPIFLLCRFCSFIFISGIFFKRKWL